MPSIVDSHRPGMKYVAFQADTEAAFTSEDFRDFQGVYTPDIIRVCEEHAVPYTWLIIVDKDHTEAGYMAREVYPARRNMDEFSIHAHFKWFVMEYRFEHETFKLPEKRLAFLREAKVARAELGLPMPRTFRYGGGDSQDRYYHIVDFQILVDELGVRNFMMSADRIPDIVGLTEHHHQGNNVWTVDGGRELTLLATTVYLDNDTESVISAIDERLTGADYSVIGCHDYREIVPRNMDAAIRHILDRYPDVRFVTSDEIGDLVRDGKIENAPVEPSTGLPMN